MIGTACYILGLDRMSEGFRYEGSCPDILFRTYYFELARRLGQHEVCPRMQCNLLASGRGRRSSVSRSRIHAVGLEGLSERTDAGPEIMWRFVLFDLHPGIDI